MSQSKKLKKTRATKRGTFLGSAGDWFGLVSSCYVWKVGGRRALTMQIYLRSSLVVIGQLVEVFIVPFFILMSNVHRENMQTQKNIINSWKWRAVKHSNKSPLFCFKLGSLTVGLAKNIKDDCFIIHLKTVKEPGSHCTDCRKNLQLWNPPNFMTRYSTLHRHTLRSRATSLFFWLFRKGRREEIKPE